MHARELPALNVENTPGDLLITNHRTKHSSFGGGNQRRILAISFGERYKENDLTELRQQIGELATLGEWLEERTYGEKMIRTANVDRMRHLEQRMANDGHLTKLVRKARLTRLNKLTPDHQIIVKVIKRQSKITSQALWKAYQVECQRESRIPVLCKLSPTM